MFVWLKVKVWKWKFDFISKDELLMEFNPLSVLLLVLCTKVGIGGCSLVDSNPIIPNWWLFWLMLSFLAQLGPGVAMFMSNTFPNQVKLQGN